MSYPWEEHDGHGVIERGEKSRISGYVRKRPGQVDISANHGQGNVWLYDVPATIEQAKRDGWGLSEAAKAELAQRLQREPTKAEIIAESVAADMKRMRDWLNDKWEWVGVSVVAYPDYANAIEALENFDGGDVTDGNDWQTEAIEALKELQSREPDEEYENALWGIEGDGEEYIQEVAEELAGQI